MLNKLLKLLGVLLVGASLFSFYQKESPTPVALSEILATENTENTQTHFPLLIIKDLGISSAIYPAVLKDGGWQPDSRGVSVNENVIYGHNWKSILGNLVNAKPGMEIEVRDRDSVRKYVINITQEIDPKDTNIIKQNADNKIVIYTCSGILDTKRFVVVATKVS